ncbi:SDR family NAD(P)-dependent oxidoreductase [Amycolatopsis sp. NPDC059021]|uniref:SDR family NAD(P)-dependent oxidoreductase n=1 Tax=Amycolatopsis sp. NPDC059021 TaxID=3346704 RepID=UPI0036728E9C
MTGRGDPGLAGRTALVTGGTRGVGRAVVLALARHGVRVVTCHRRGGEAAGSLERALRETGGGHHVLRADLADPGEVGDLFAHCAELVGGLDIVVNNAAEISRVPFGELSLSEWRQTIGTNARGAHLVIQRALPLLRDGASVISISSAAARLGVAAQAHYTASKAALHGLSRSLAKEFGVARGIRFTVLALGMVHTEALDELPEPVREQLIARYTRLIPLGRLATPDDAADAVLWLSGDGARYLTGTVVPVDGGL